MVTSLLFGIFGLVVLIAIAYLFSSNRSAVNWRIVITGLGLQLLFALIVLHTTIGAAFFDFLSSVFVTIIGFTDRGSEFIFGPLIDPEKSNGFIFAFKVLPTIIFFSSLMSVLYYLGIMQRIVQAMAWVMTKAMNISGAESLSVAANVFIGQTEAPLVVRPYIAKMTQSELLTMMVGGMATIAGGVLAAYVGLLGNAPGMAETYGSVEAAQVFYAKHLLSASIMAAPATILLAKILYPETEESLTKGEVKVSIEVNDSNVIEAAANGAADGLKLALNVAAMLLAFIALIYMLDAPLAWFGRISGINDLLGQELNLALLLGYAFSPLAWVIGVPWHDAQTIGSLIGQKLVINEFFAYANLSQLPAEAISPKARLIATYALCGFANFSSIAIQIGGIGGIAPSRKSDLARFGLRAVLGGTLATMMTATIAGVLTGF